jgi:hypothetical protein
MSKFNRLDQVAIRGTKVPFTRGVFINLSSAGDAAAVELDSWGRKTIDYFPIDSVIPAALAVAEENKVETERDLLTKELEMARLAVSEQIGIATAALENATEIANKLNVSLSDEFYDEARPFLNALDGAGWSSSSLNC